MLIREVQVSDGGTGVVGLSLHQQITVVAGLDPGEQVELADLVAAVVYGRTDDLGGSVEIGGEVLNVEAWGEMVGEALDATDVFIRPADVPRSLSPVVGEDGSAEAEERARQLLAAVAAARQELHTAERTLAEAESTERRARLVLEEAQRQPELCEEEHWPNDPAAIQSPFGNAGPEYPTQHDTDALRTALTRSEASLEKSREAGRAAAAHAERQRSLVESLRAELAVAAADLAAATAACDTIATALDDLRRQLGAAQATSEAERTAMVAAEASVQAEAESRAAAHAAAELEAARQAEAATRAEGAMAEAEAASRELARAVAAADEAAEAVTSATAVLDLPVDVQGDELARLDRRAEQLGEDLARARAEESLFAGLAASQDIDPGEGAPMQGTVGRPGSVLDGLHSVTDDALAIAEAEARTATARAASLRAELEALVASDRPSTLRGGELVERRRMAAERLEQIRQEIDALRASPDLGVLSAAVDRLRAIPADDQIAGSGALMGALDELIAARAEASLGTAPRWLVEAARTGLEEARIELARAEEMCRPMRVSPEDAAALVAAHAAIEDAESKAEKRFGGVLARRRLEKATADERELLLRLGLPSYTAFVFRTMPMASGSDAAVHLEIARRAMGDAEAVWEELHQGAAAADTAETEESEARVLAEAAAIIGADAMGRADRSNPSATLRSVRALLAEAIASVAQRSQAEQDLVAIVDGIDGLEADGADVLGDAVRWLEFHDADERRRSQLRAEMVGIAADLEQAQRSIDHLEQPPPSDPDVRAALERAVEIAELEAIGAREWLQDAAISSGIAPAAAAVAADPALLLVGTGQPGGESGEASWARQSSVEVEVSRRDIAAIEEEVAEVAARREDLGAGAPVAPSAETLSAPDIAALIAAQQTAEAELAEAQRVADAATAAAEDALEALELFDRRPAETVPEHAGGDLEDRARIAERHAAAQGVLQATTTQIASAERRLALASAEVAARREDHLRSDERYKEALLSLDTAEAAFRRAAEVTLGCEQLVLEARGDLESAEAAHRAAAERREAQRIAAEDFAAGALRRTRAREEALVAVEVAHTAHVSAGNILAFARSEVDLARISLSSAQQAQAVAYPDTTSADEVSSRSQERRGDGGEAELYMMSRLATARSIGAFGAVPLILLDPFVDLRLEEQASIHELLVRMGAVVQMIYITADPEIAQWGIDLGPVHATVLQFGEPAPTG